jgi:hypothetical protein
MVVIKLSIKNKFVARQISIANIREKKHKVKFFFDDLQIEDFWIRSNFNLFVVKYA